MSSKTPSSRRRGRKEQAVQDKESKAYKDVPIAIEEEMASPRPMYLSSTAMTRGRVARGEGEEDERESEKRRRA